MLPVPHLERIIDKDEAARLIVRTKIFYLKSRTTANEHIDIDTAIARLLSTKRRCVDRSIQLPDGRRTSLGITLLLPVTQVQGSKTEDQPHEESSDSSVESVSGSVERRIWMSLILTAICIASLCLLIPMWNKRTRDRQEWEQHSITPEALHTLLASNHDVLVFDVRQPLDLLVDSEIIPGAKRIPPKDVLENPSLIPKEKDSIVYCTCPTIKPAVPFCAELSPCISCGSNFSRADCRAGKRRAIRSSHTKAHSISILAPSSALTETSAATRRFWTIGRPTGKNPGRCSAVFRLRRLSEWVTVEISPLHSKSPRRRSMTVNACLQL